MDNSLLGCCGGNLLRRRSSSEQAVAAATVLFRCLAWLLAYCLPRDAQKRIVRCGKSGCGGNSVPRCRSRLGMAGMTFLVVAAAGLTAACSTLPTTKEEPEVLIKRAQAVDYARQGDENLVNRNFGQAEVFYQQSLEVNWATDNLEGVVQAHFSLGFLYLGLGYADRAATEYDEAAEAAQMLGNPGLVADCQLNRAKVELYLGHAQAALDRLDAALQALGKDTADKEGIRRAAFLDARGQALKDLGRLDEARAALNEALAVNLKRKARKEPAANLYLLASISHREGKLEEALTFVDRALELDKQAENSEGIAKDLYARNVLLQKLNGPDGKPRLQEAWDALRRSYRVSLAISDAVSVARDLEQLQDLAARLGLDAEQARYAAVAAKLKSAQSGGEGLAVPDPEQGFGPLPNEKGTV